MLDPNLTWSRESKESDLATCDVPEPEVMSRLKSLYSMGHVAAKMNLWAATPLESEHTNMTSVLRASL